MRAWENVKTQEKNGKLSVVYTSQSPGRLENPWAVETTCCFADNFLAGAGLNAFASRVLMALQPCGTLRVGFNGINALASHVLMALQLCGFTWSGLWWY